MIIIAPPSGGARFSHYFMSEVRGLQFRDLKGNVLTVCRSNIYFDGSNNVRDMNKTYKSTRKLIYLTT